MKGLREFFKSLDLENEENPLTWLLAILVFVGGVFMIYFIRVEIPTMIKNSLNGANITQEYIAADLSTSSLTNDC